MSAQQFQYTPIPPFSGGMPLIDMMLSHGDQDLQVSALVDSGAALNRLPYDIYNWGFDGKTNVCRFQQVDY